LSKSTNYKFSMLKLTCAAGEEDDETFIQKKVASFGADMKKSQAELDRLTGNKKRSKPTNEGSLEPAGLSTFVAANYNKKILQSKTMPDELRQLFLKHPEEYRNQVVVDFMTDLGAMLESDFLVDKIAKAPFAAQFEMMAVALADMCQKRDRNLTWEVAVEKVHVMMGETVRPYSNH
jgi:hypothetical protein